MPPFPEISIWLKSYWLLIPYVHKTPVEDTQQYPPSLDQGCLYIFSLYMILNSDFIGSILKCLNYFKILSLDTACFDQSHGGHMWCAHQRSLHYISYRCMIEQSQYGVFPENWQKRSSSWYRRRVGKRGQGGTGVELPGSIWNIHREHAVVYSHMISRCLLCGWLIKQRRVEMIAKHWSSHQYMITRDLESCLCSNIPRNTGQLWWSYGLCNRKIVSRRGKDSKK